MPRLGRYFVVSTMGFAIQLGCVWALTAAGVRPAMLVAAVGVGLAALHNFAWHSAWTFRDRHEGREGHEGDSTGPRRAGAEMPSCSSCLSS